MKKLAALLALLLCVAFAIPASAAMNKYSTMFLDTFDTVTTLIGFAQSEKTFNEQAELVHNLYLYTHKLFDAYNSYEDEGIVNIYTLNQRAAQAPVEVDPILFNLLLYCKEHYDACQGQVNIAMGSVLSIWHDYREAGLDDPDNAQLPPMKALVAAQAHTDIDDLILDKDAMTVYFADPQLRLDVGAVAKGYATELISQALYDGPMKAFIISAGGNVRLGEMPYDGRTAWGVGIQDPDGSVLGLSDYVEVIYDTDISIVTSGDYQRFYTVDGVNYHHLIDPDTLMPATAFRSVSILTEDSAYADLLSTTAFLMTYEESRAFIESLDGVDAIWVLPDGTIEMTDGAKKVAASCGAKNR